MGIDTLPYEKSREENDFEEKDLEEEDFEEEEEEPEEEIPEEKEEAMTFEKCLEMMKKSADDRKRMEDEIKKLKNNKMVLQKEKIEGIISEINGSLIPAVVRIKSGELSDNEEIKKHGINKVEFRGENGICFCLDDEVKTIKFGAGNELEVYGYRNIEVIESARDCENLYNSFKAIQEVIPIVKKELMKVMLEQMKINDEANLNAEKEIEKMKKDIKKIEKE
jgi:hypothetical protein